MGLAHRSELLSPFFPFFLRTEGKDMDMSMVPHIAACAILAVIGASFSSLDRGISVWRMFWYLGLAGFIGGFTVPMKHAFFPTLVWYVCTFPSFVLGFCVYGLAVALKKSDSSVGSVDLIGWLKSKYTKSEGEKP